MSQPVQVYSSKRALNRHLLKSSLFTANTLLTTNNKHKQTASRASRSRSRARTTPIYLNMLNDPSILSINQVNMLSDLDQQDWLLNDICPKENEDFQMLKEVLYASFINEASTKSSRSSRL